VAAAVGDFSSIRSACCFKLKIHTHSLAHTLSWNTFHVCSFRWPKIWFMPLGAYFLYLCIFIGFVQLLAMDFYENIAHTPHCTFTANRILIFLATLSKLCPRKMVTPTRFRCTWTANYTHVPRCELPPLHSGSIMLKEYEYCLI